MLSPSRWLVHLQVLSVALQLWQCHSSSILTALLYSALKHGTALGREWTSRQEGAAFTSVLSLLSSSFSIQLLTPCHPLLPTRIFRIACLRDHIVTMSAMFEKNGASPGVSSELTGESSLESSPAQTSSMSRQSSAQSFETAASSVSYDFDDCHFDFSLFADTNAHHGDSSMTSLTRQPPWLEGDFGISPWMSQLSTINPVNLTYTSPADSFNLPYQDFELFPQEPYTSQEPPLPSITHTRSHVPDPVFAESAAARAASQSLYVDKATSIYNDLPVAPRKAYTGSKRPIAQPSPRPSTVNKVTKRHACRLPSCGKSFVRRSDVLRHQADVHNLAAEFYRCEALSCEYHTKRSDKMKEHCQKMHGHQKGTESFVVVQRE